MKGHSVVLTTAEQDYAADRGVARYDESVSHRRRDTNARNDPKSHVLGAMGELAARKYLGMPMRLPVNQFKAESDLPGGLEVRTRSRWDDALIVRPNDPPDRIYVLVVAGALPGEYRIVGSILGSAARNPAWLVPGRNGWSDAWFVPQSHLEEM